METVTLQGPVIVLPADEYKAILNRLTQLEQRVNQLTQSVEDFDDIKAMHEAETEYRTGDAITFDDLLAEMQTERE